MAKVSVSVDVPLSPEEAWQHASDLSRYKEWLIIHRVWRSKLPENIGTGTVVESIIEVKGMPNRIKWTIVHFTPPESMTLNGVGAGGVKVKLIGKVRPAGQAGAKGAGRGGAERGGAERGGAASVVTMDVHLGGPALFGPIGMLVAAALRSDIQSSLDRFVAVFASGAAN
jgi:hypothetical protein